MNLARSLLYDEGPFVKLYYSFKWLAEKSLTHVLDYRLYAASAYRFVRLPLGGWQKEIKLREAVARETGKKPKEPQKRLNNRLVEYQSTTYVCPVHVSAADPVAAPSTRVRSHLASSDPDAW